MRDITGLVLRGLTDALETVAAGNTDPDRLAALARKALDAYNALPDDTIAITWCIDDVLEVRPGLNREQAREVLRLVESEQDATVGVTWETLECWADRLYPDVVHPEDTEED